MHIEPGLVDPAKMILAYGTAAGGAAATAKFAWDSVKERGVTSLAARTAATTAATLIFFQVLPHFPVGISEVHFILGSTLLLVFGAAPAALGLALGLLIQGIFFAPFDLPQYFANVTSLIVPLVGIAWLAKTLIPAKTAYVDIKYKDALALSTAYQGGVVAWVAFWAFYGQGFGAATTSSVFAFGGAYMLVVLIEPLVDLAVLAAAKSMRGLDKSGIVTSRLFNAA